MGLLGAAECCNQKEIVDNLINTYWQGVIRDSGACSRLICSRGVMAIYEQFSSAVLLILVIALHSLNMSGKDCEGEFIVVR